MGRPGRAEPRRGAATAMTTCWPRRTWRFCRRKSSTSCECSSHGGIRTVDSLDPNCNGPCVGEDQGGPTLEIPVSPASAGTDSSHSRVSTTAIRCSRRSASSAASTNGKRGFEYNYVNHKVQALPLHFGGRYIFQPLPAIPGLVPAPITGDSGLALGLPAAYIQGYGNSSRRTATVISRCSRRTIGVCQTT